MPIKTKLDGVKPIKVVMRLHGLIKLKKGDLLKKGDFYLCQDGFSGMPTASITGCPGCIVGDSDAGTGNITYYRKVN